MVKYLKTNKWKTKQNPDNPFSLQPAIFHSNLSQVSVAGRWRPNAKHFHYPAQVFSCEMCYQTGPIMKHVGHITEWGSKTQGNRSCVSTRGQDLQPTQRLSKLKTLGIFKILRYLRHTKRSKIQYKECSFSQHLFILHELKK